MQTKDYYQIEIITWNYMIVYELLVLDWNTWNLILYLNDLYLTGIFDM